VAVDLSFDPLGLARPEKTKNRPGILPPKCEFHSQASSSRLLSKADANFRITQSRHRLLRVAIVGLQRRFLHDSTKKSLVDGLWRGNGFPERKSVSSFPRTWGRGQLSADVCLSPVPGHRLADS
jgi:hypothetical protein